MASASFSSIVNVPPLSVVPSHERAYIATTILRPQPTAALERALAAALECAR